MKSPSICSSSITGTGPLDRHWLVSLCRQAQSCQTFAALTIGRCPSRMTTLQCSLLVLETSTPTLAIKSCEWDTSPTQVHPTEYLSHVKIQVRLQIGTKRSALLPLGSRLLFMAQACPVKTGVLQTGQATERPLTWSHCVTQSVW